MADGFWFRPQLFEYIFLSSVMYNTVHLLAVASGGALGAFLRYTVTLLSGKFGSGSFPIDTLLVNTAGCFLIGLVIQWVLSSPDVGEVLKLFLITGLIGSFTTFSTFSYEFISLLKDQEFRSLAIYAGAHLVLGFSFVMVGLWSGSVLIPGVE